MSVMGEIKGFLIATWAALKSFFMPIGDFMLAMIVLFIVNFTFGLIADIVNGVVIWKKPSDTPVTQANHIKGTASALRIINGLANVADTQTLTLSSTTKSTLSATEKAVLINKGWTLA